MTDQQIVSALKNNPHLDIWSMSLRLNLPTITISKAQHEHLKAVMHKHRSSKAWEMKHYNKHIVNI